MSIRATNIPNGSGAPEPCTTGPIGEATSPVVRRNEAVPRQGRVVVQTPSSQG